MKRSILFLLLTALVLLPAQADVPDMKFRRLDTTGGLSNSQVNCVMRDSHGFIWIGTAYGLNRYDGYRVKTFYSNIRDTTTMRDNYTHEIMEAWDGKLWLRQGMNYCVYDPRTEHFERNASHELEQYFGFSQGVERIYIDKKKNFWVKFYEKGLYYYNPHTKKLVHFKIGYADDEVNPDYGISSITEFNGKVAMSTYNGELMLLDGERGVKVWEDRWMRNHGAPQSQEFKLNVDGHGNLWVSAEAYTYIRMANGRWYDNVMDFLRERSIVDVPENLQIWDLKFDHHGRLWVATDHDGLIVIDLKSRQLRQFLNSKYDMTTISDNTLRNIYVASDDIVWVGTYKNGVNMYKEGSASMMNLELGDINTVSEDRFGNYWLGTNVRGIVVYNPKTGEEVANYTSSNSPMLGNIMVGSHRASDGSIWFGGYNSGMTRCIPRNANGEATIISYRATGEPGALATNNVWSVTEDKWHRIWIGTLGAGIQMLDLKTGKFRTWDTGNSQLPSNYMTSASWIKKGWLMVGTSWYYCFVNPVTGKLANRIIPEDPAVPVQTGTTVCVMEDSRGIIWQGSNSGVVAYDAARHFVRLFDMSDGLFGSSVCSVIEDKNKTIWVVTDHGISKIVPYLEDGKWQFSISSYNSRDGLQQATYNQRSTCLTKDGLILVGGQGGLDVINPKALSDAKSKERPVFSGLQLFDVDVPVGVKVDGRLILDEALDVCRSITMRYNDQFTIQLGSDAGLVDNGKRFVYRLEGFNENWVKTSELNPNITYNSLSAGDYVLHVRMLNDDGTFGEVESTLDITIRPPLWRTRWMLLIYMLLIAAVAWYWRKRFLHRHDQRVKAENLRQETEKMQWMSDMRMQLAKENVNGNENDNDNESGNENGNALTIVPVDCDLVVLVKNVCRDFSISSEGLKAKLNYRSLVDELSAPVDRKLMSEALNILLSNSVRFSPGDCQITVNLGRSDGDKAVIEVSDNSIGIRDEFKATAFEPMVGSEGIGLDRVKNIVVAHDGTIRLQDNPGGGTVFIITLPANPEIEEAVLMDE